MEMFEEVNSETRVVYKHKESEYLKATFSWRQMSWRSTMKNGFNDVAEQFYLGVDDQMKISKYEFQSTWIVGLLVEKLE